MLTTLKAVVQGDRIQWLEASEQTFPAAHPIAALITPLDEQTAGTPKNCELSGGWRP
ncbi:MAG: hypothetical protein WCL11_01560 [Verrucomicrobiota bacterium]